MPRDLILEILHHEDPNEETLRTRLDHKASKVIIRELCERWMKMSPPGKEMHVEQVDVRNAADEWRGFRYYLVWGEPHRLGSMRVEIKAFCG